MEYYVLDNYRDKPPKKLNTKKVIKTAIIFLIILLLIVIIASYIANSEFRAWTDKYILGKEMTENTGPIIQIDSESDPYLYAYDRYINVFSKNVLQNYNGDGRKESEIEITITNPIFASCDRYLCVAEKNGNKIYLISGEHIIWQKDLEEEISQISVNKNGYVSVNHKSSVKLFNSDGKDLTTVHLASTHAIDTVVSNDNSELAIAEINYSGSLLQSSIKIVSIEKVSTDPDNAVIYTYKADKKTIITSLKYQDNNTLICMSDNGIMKRTKDNELTEVKFDTDTIFADINLNGYSVEIIKNKSSLFNSQIITQINQISNNRVNNYNVKSLPVAVKTYENVIALNMGTDVEFINTNGWLIKKYTSTRNIKDVIICNNLAGIVYKDKIELISL